MASIDRENSRCRDRSTETAARAMAATASGSRQAISQPAMRSATVADVARGMGARLAAVPRRVGGVPRGAAQRAILP